MAVGYVRAQTRDHAIGWTYVPNCSNKINLCMYTSIQSSNKELRGHPEQVDFPARQASCKLSAN